MLTGALAHDADHAAELGTGLRCCPMSWEEGLVPVPDWLDYLNAGGTTVAALIAAGAYRLAGKQAESLRVERRIDFELRVLEQMIALLPEQGGYNYDGAARMQDLARLIPAGIIPLTHEVFGVGEEATSVNPHTLFWGRAGKEQVRTELSQAVISVLSGRPRSPVNQRRMRERLRGWVPTDADG
jgi:hypothetical protein